MQKVNKKDVLKVLDGLNLDVKPDNIDPSKSLADQGVDSLDLANILFGLQDAFSIEITDDSIANGDWLTINNIVININNILNVRG